MFINVLKNKDGILQDGPGGMVVPGGGGPCMNPGRNDKKNDRSKKKRRAATTQGYTSRPWNKVDAEKALACEMEYQKVTGDKSIVIRFPDPDLSREIVKRFHPNIESVHFQAPSGGRYSNYLFILPCINILCASYIKLHTYCVRVLLTLS